LYNLHVSIPKGEATNQPKKTQSYYINIMQGCKCFYFSTPYQNTTQIRSTSVSITTKPFCLSSCCHEKA